MRVGTDSSLGLLLFLLFAAIVIAYLPAIQATYIWDDARYVTDNETLRSLDGLRSIWFDVGATIQYYPLVFTTFWIEYRFWGLDPLGYHLVNVILHAIGAILLGFALRRLAIPGAWLIAGIFGLHPLQVESVAWISERKNVLSGLLYLGALLSYLRYAGIGQAEEPSDRPMRHYLLALILFTGALLSKTVTCSLPAAILLILWWKRERFERKDLIPLLPMFLLGLGMGLLTIRMERVNVGAEGIDWAIPFLDRLLIAGRAIWFYAGKIVLPIQLAFNYPRWTVQAGSGVAWLYPIAFLVALLVSWFTRRRIGKGPLVALLFFSGTLLPALGFIDVYPMRYSFVASHFQYLAGIGVIGLVVGCAARLFRRTGPAQVRLVPVAVSVALLSLLAVTTFRQAKEYHDQETLWRATLDVNRSSFLAHCNLGALLLDRGELAAAESHLAEAVRLKPNFYEAHANLGRALVDQGRLEEGRQHYEEALRHKPELGGTWCSLGNLLLQMGKPSEAVPKYRQAIALDSGFMEARANLATALSQQGNLEEAVAQYGAALRLKPDDPRIHTNLANGLVQLGRLGEAIPHYRAALELRPDDAGTYRNLGLTLARTGDTNGAIQALWLALRHDRSDIVAHFQLGELLRMTGQPEGAEKEYRATLALDPEHAGARAGLQAIGGKIE